MIKSIDASSVHRICSSQVVVDLATAVKELVENALDAGASVVEIFLTEFGEALIEVHDNAKGIDPVDFEGLALKHHTSKINQFEDVATVTSYGFRGEALNSLCELSEKFSITTKREQDANGHRLHFDRMGRLCDQELIARESGTSVIIENLFAALPVRRFEYIRNIKKHYQKMLRVVQAYALFATGVKFVMVNVTKGARQTVLSTQKTSRIEDNICNIFGSKFLSTLQVFSTPVLSSTELENNGDVSAEGELAVPQRLGDVTGYISKIGLGIGRSDNDRQFIFCNGRPIDLPRLVKAVNEIWRKYEMKQKPAFIIDIRINRNSVDVNLAPNKREVLIENEDLLIEQFRNAIDSMYSSSKNVLEVNSNLEIRKLTDFSAFSALSTQAEIKSSQATNSNDSSSRSTEIAGRDIPVEHGDTAEISPAISHPDVSAISHSNLDSHVSDSKEVTWASPAEQSRLAQVVTSQESVALRDQTIKDNDRGPIEDEWISSSFSKIPWLFTSTRKRALNNVYESANCSEPIRKQGDLGVKRRRQEALSLTAESENNNSLENINSSVRIIDKNDFSQMRVIGQFNLGFIIVELDGDMYILDQHACDEKFRFEKLQKNTKLNSQPLLKPLVVEMTAALESVVEDNLDVFESNGFELGIDDSAPAGRRISMRSMPFSKGIQFGVTDVVELASLICGDDGEDFYDGRMNKNYLSLRNESMFKSQSLPSSLASTKKAVPKVLLPKIMAMFASRACRSAVMIGTALNRKEMLSIVNQMVSVEQPWNCPHGRPTMRHLFDYDAVVAASTKNDWNETNLKSSEISLAKLNQLGLNLQAIDM